MDNIDKFLAKLDEPLLLDVALPPECIEREFMHGTARQMLKEAKESIQTCHDLCEKHGKVGDFNHGAWLYKWNKELGEF